MNKLIFLGLINLLLLSNTNIPLNQTQSEIDLSLRQLFLNEGYSNTFEIKYHNKSEEPLRIIKSMDGSMYGWIYPRHQFIVKDKKGNDLEYLGRCGLYGMPYSGTSFPEDYVVAIPPKTSYSDTLYIIQSVPENGKYEISFEYEFLDKNLPLEHKLYENIWEGKAVTETKSYLLQKK